MSTYLARAARRVAPLAAPGLRPAMPSRSPLAEADQRLNLDAFAERFDAPVMPSPGFGAAEVGAMPTPITPTPSPAGAPSVGDPAERHTVVVGNANQIGAEPDTIATDAEPATRDSAPPEPHATVPAGRGPSPQRDAEPSVLAGPPAGRAPTADPEPDVPLPLDVAVPEPPPRGRSSGPARRHSEAAPIEENRSVPEASPSRAPEPTESATPTVPAAPSTRAVFDAVRRATSWIERGAAQPAPDERGAVAERPASAWPAAPTSDEARAHARAARSSRGPVTHLEIGRIEVEVVPPAPAARQPARAAPKPSSRAEASPSRRFGWRQR